MCYSAESLQAVIQTVASGSFSAAARAWSKSQSTISAAIARLEDELCVQLFDRQSGQPVLTEAGQRVLSLFHNIIAAGQRLEELSRQLSEGGESRLTLAISDIWPAHSFEQLLTAFAHHYPQVSLQCITAEDADIIGLVQNGRANLGLLLHQSRLQPQLAGRMLPVSTELNIWMASVHPLTRLQSGLRLQQLNTVRQLIHSSAPQAMPQGWSAYYCWIWIRKDLAGVFCLIGLWLNLVTKALCLWLLLVIRKNLRWMSYGPVIIYLTPQVSGW